MVNAKAARRLQVLLAFGLTGPLCAAWLPTGTALAGPADEAREILASTGVKGGLIVHLGCGDGKLTAALHAGGRFTVRGLDADAEKVTAAREHIQSLGLYGPVSVETWEGSSLPYADNLVNLLVAEKLDRCSMEEVLRVLAPLGVAYVRTADGWRKTIKPWPRVVFAALYVGFVKF